MKNRQMFVLLDKITHNLPITENNNNNNNNFEFYNWNNSLLNDNGVNKEHVLCIGQVQSGKTKNMENIIINGVKNGYCLIIVLAGINKILFGQTNNRLQNNINMDKTRFIDKHWFDKIKINIESGNNVIVNVLKTYKQLNDLFDYIDNINLVNKKVLIIDDECDFASVNISPENESKIYSLISKLYNRIHIGKLASFTGTPFANILSSNSEELYPNRLVVLKHYDNYCGLHYFNNSNNYILTDFKKNENISIIYRKVFIQWLISTSGGLIDDEYFKSELLINVEINNSKQEIIFKNIIEIFDLFYKNIQNEDWIKKIIIKWCEDKSIIEEYTVDLIYKKIKEIIVYLHNDIENCFILLNADNDSEKFKSGKKKFCIIVGGYMISRGFTFEYLTIELFLNVPNESKVAVDTLLQRCRWFGNRKKNNRIKFLKIFMNKKVLDSLKESESYLDLFQGGVSTKNISYYVEKINILDKININVESTSAIKRK
ncbi:Z1 domain-containing protein [Malacoplasma muris]|uniref:Z1 domain-containing protein n=1 Tax=Malacoplasma muris TaxID=2119 RepID=UPI00398EDB58